jgi:hypothetical protein
MTDRSTGPVKPPVIDLTARSSATRDEAEAAAAEAAPRRARRRLDPGAAGWPLLGGAVLAGALVGTLLTYLLAGVLPLPTRPGPDLGPELAAQSARLDTLAAHLDEIEARGTRTQVSLDATIAQLDSGLAAASSDIAALRDAIPELPPPVDLTPLETALKTLKAQVDAIAAGASGADASAIAEALARLDASVATVETRLTGVDRTISALRTDLDAARAALAAHIDSALPNEVGPALKLPLILSGLEAAFAGGRPYAGELAALRGVLPDLAVPDVLAAHAASGLVRPDALAARFADTVPAILGARDTTGGDWAQSAIDWARTLLALRPIGESEGTSPEAIVSRLEAAVARRDFAAASALIGQLPGPMQDAAALVAGDIRAHAAAAGLVAELRARALATTATP